MRFALRFSSLSVFCALLLALPGATPAIDPVKITGYITARDDAGKIMILDDVIRLEPGAKLEWDGGDGRRSLQPGELVVGVLIEAEGVWAAKHEFRASKITAEAEIEGKVIKEKAFIAHLPTDAAKIEQGAEAQLKLDGELLQVNTGSRRSWQAPKGLSSDAGVKPVRPEAALLGRRVEYRGTRRPDGTVAVEDVELGESAPPDAYKVPDEIVVARAQEPKTGIDILEFRKGKKTVGRMKLFPVLPVQEYVRNLGLSLLPPGADSIPSSVEFRFFVVEDPSINAAAFPDGTVLVNTGLLGACENEAQLAFVLSHEIAHVLQVHHWRHVTETRTKRILITIAAIAGSYYIGDLGRFLGAIGMEALVNGYSRRLENQADRIALQNLVELGYDANQSCAFSRLLIDRYSMRSISKVFSTHNSPTMRGSFLSVQIRRQYPDRDFSKAKISTEVFGQMKTAMGPVKIM